jgi:hypothetical protein
MNCPACAVELPADARFCVECGFEVRPASTGKTTFLPRYAEGGPTCAACGTVGPEGADYCVRCGHRLTAPTLVPLPQPTQMVPASKPPRRQYTAPARAKRRHRHAQKHLGGPVFLIGLGAIFLLKAPIFPAILVVIGLSVFVSAAARGGVVNGLKHAFWLFGIAVLFAIPRLWFPGLLVLIGLNVLFEMAQRAMQRP